jgi:hypothetical protein
MNKQNANINDEIQNIQLDNSLPLDVIFVNLENISKINTQICKFVLIYHP